MKTPDELLGMFRQAQSDKMERDVTFTSPYSDDVVKQALWIIYEEGLEDGWDAAETAWFGGQS